MSSPDDLMLSEHKRIENGDMPQQGKVFLGGVVPRFVK